MSKQPPHPHEAFWEAWESGNPAALSEDERTMLALAHALEGLYAPPRQHQVRLWAQLRARHSTAMHHYHIRRHWMTLWKTTRNLTAAAISLILLVVLLQWSIHSLPGSPATPTAPVAPAAPLQVTGCFSDVPPLQAGEAPSNAATLGGQSVRSGDFWFTMLVYCDPSLKAGRDSLLDGLGIWGQWNDQGTFQEGSLTEWWGPEGEEILADVLSAPLPTPVTRFSGWMPQSPVDFTRPQVTLSFVHKVETPKGTFGARLRLTLHASATGWRVDNVTVDAVEKPEATPLAAPSTDIIPPQRLSLTSTPEEIRAKVQNPSWESVWVMGTRIEVRNGVQQVRYGQAYLTSKGRGWLLVSDSIPVENVMGENTPGRWKVHERLEASNSTLFGKHPLLATFQPDFLDDSLSPQPRFESVYAGRAALVVDWGANRLWIDEDTGLILSREHYRAGNPPDGDLDVTHTWLVVVYAPHNAAAPPDTFGTPPALQIPDIAYARLRFESNALTDEADAVVWRIYADDAYLGAMESRRTSGLGCDRSSDGKYIAWVDGDPFQGMYLNWMPLTNPWQVSTGFDLPSPNSPPTWAPDKPHLAYAGCQESMCGLFVVETESHEARYLTDTSPQLLAPPLWSPDGTQIAILQAGETGSAEVRVINASDGTEVYHGLFDTQAWSAALDSPIAAWGVNFPPDIGNYTRCTAPPAARLSP